MKKTGVFYCEAPRPTMMVYPACGNLWLADDTERELADMQLLHGR